MYNAKEAIMIEGKNFHSLNGSGAKLLRHLFPPVTSKNFPGQFLKVV
jgi:hypothetical protein